MNLGKKQISTKQLIFSIVCFIQASSLIANFSTSVTAHETWIAVIAGYLISLPVLLIYTILSKTFPGKDIVEINIELFGNIPGRLLSLLYIYFFFSLAFLNTQIVGNFMSGFLLSKTPIIIIYAMFISICVYAVRSGVEVIARFSFVFACVIFLILFLTSLLLIKDMKLSNFFPVFSLPIKKYVQSAHTMATLPFCEILSFFMLFPYADQPGKTSRVLLVGMTIGAITILVTVLRDTLVLGPSISFFTFPNYQTIRQIQVGSTSSRMEVLYAIALLMLMFFKVSILLFATVKGITEVLNLHAYKNLAPTIGVLIIISALTAFGSIADHAFWGANIAAVYSTFFVVILPGISLLTLAIKKKTSSLNRIN
ncbi:MAG: endospore germination permease [Intestinimonas sp.]|jgi:spore germination protein KB|nr:endospore germination permease [Intestinimonas sp.]